jgi:hypothetical protein
LTKEADFINSILKDIKWLKNQFTKMK